MQIFLYFLRSSQNPRQMSYIPANVILHEISSCCQIDIPPGEVDETLCCRITYRDKVDDSFSVYKFLNDYKEIVKIKFENWLCDMFNTYF